jgi:hypothetical protein
LKNLVDAHEHFPLLQLKPVVAVPHAVDALEDAQAAAYFEIFSLFFLYN